MYLLYITVSTKEEATLIARTLVQEKLLACVNITECVSSIYWWEGSLHEGSECIMIAKSPSETVSQAISRVKELHSYDCPCILSIKITEGNEDFLKWVETSAKLPYS